MSSKRSIIVEGITDRAIFESLLCRLGLASVARPKRCPQDKIELSEFDIDEGKNKDKAIEIFKTKMKMALASPMLFLAVDLDSMEREDLYKQVGDALEHEGVDGEYTIGDSRGMVIPLGLEAVRDEWELDRVAIDDYILSLATNEVVFEGLRDQARRHGPKIKLTHEKAMHKMRRSPVSHEGAGISNRSIESLPGNIQGSHRVRGLTGDIRGKSHCQLPGRESPEVYVQERPRCLVAKLKVTAFRIPLLAGGCPLWLSPRSRSPR